MGSGEERIRDGTLEFWDVVYGLASCAFWGNFGFPFRIDNDRHPRLYLECGLEFDLVLFLGE